MKVREQRVTGLKFEWRPDEKIGLASEGLNLPARGRGFQRACDGGADGNNPPAGPFPFSQALSNFWRERAPLAVHRVFIESLDGDRPECADTNVQGHALLLNAPVRQLSQQLGCEMQARSWCRDRAGPLGIDRLIGIAILRDHLAVANVGRQGNSPNAV